MGEKSRALKTAKELEHVKEEGLHPIVGQPNLYLQVRRKSGKTTGGEEFVKSWIFRFQHSKKPDYMGLGRLRDRPLAAACLKAQECRQLLADRINPREARDKVEAAKAAALSRAKLFPWCVEQFMKDRRAEWTNAKHAAQWDSTLKTYCYPEAPADPVWNKVAVSEIDEAKVLAVLRPLWLKKNPTATRLRGRIEEVLDWATFHKYREGLNPARWEGHLENVLAKPSKAHKATHHAALGYKKIAAFLKELRKMEGVAPRALEFVIATCTRTSEAIEARWSEIDFESKSWTIPEERMKSRKAHRVPLSAPALAVLAQMKGLDAEFIFPSRDGRPLSNMALLKVLERMERDELTVHGFRSTFRDWAGEDTNFPRDVIEMALAHRIKGKTEEAYWRGDLYEKRRRLMQAWAEYCEKPAGANVTPLHAAKKA